jgi:predicted SAM-dependent methyltransferase
MDAVPLPDGCVSTIFSSNALEHIGKHQIVPTLREWCRLLEVGGKLQIVVPDLEWACAWWLEHQEDRGWSLDILFGHQLHDGEYHKTGFTPRLLWDYFQEAGGFEVHKIEYILGDYKESPIEGSEKVKVDVSQRCISVEASKI